MVFLSCISLYGQQKLNFGLNVHSFSLVDNETWENGDVENNTTKASSFRLQGFVNKYRRSSNTFLHASVLFYYGKSDAFNAKSDFGFNPASDVKIKYGKQYGGFIGIGQDVIRNRKYSFQSLFRIGYIFKDNFKRETVESFDNNIIRKIYEKHPVSHEINAQIQLKFNYRLYKNIKLSAGVNNSLLMNLRKGNEVSEVHNYISNGTVSTETFKNEIKTSDWRNVTLRGFFGITYNL